MRLLCRKLLVSPLLLLLDKLVCCPSVDIFVAFFPSALLALAIGREPSWNGDSSEETVAAA